jgi:hypothetical protein
MEAYGDSKLVVQQIKGESQCLDGVLNEYRDRCLALVRNLEMFHIHHVPRERNRKANALAQRASRYEVTEGLFMVKATPVIAEECVADIESAETCDMGGKEESNTRPAVQSDPGASWP